MASGDQRPCDRASVSGTWRRKKRRRRLGGAVAVGAAFARLGQWEAGIQARSLASLPFSVRAAIRVLAWGRLACVSGGFERGVEHFDVALLAQVGEPLVEEHIDLLLEENLLDARRDLLKRWNGFAGAYWGRSVSR